MLNGQFGQVNVARQENHAIVCVLTQLACRLTNCRNERLEAAVMRRWPDVFDEISRVFHLVFELKDLTIDLTA